MDPEDFPVGFDPEAEPTVEEIEAATRRSLAEIAVEPEDEIPSISEEELQERLAEQAATCPTGGCGPQCASSVLAIRYAKILRQERLLAMARSALEQFETMLEGKVLSPAQAREASAPVERSRAIRKQIDNERRNN